MSSDMSVNIGFEVRCYASHESRLVSDPIITISYAIRCWHSRFKSPSSQSFEFEKSSYFPNTLSFTAKQCDQLLVLKSMLFNSLLQYPSLRWLLGEERHSNRIAMAVQWLCNGIAMASKSSLYSSILSCDAFLDSKELIILFYSVFPKSESFDTLCKQ